MFVVPQYGYAWPTQPYGYRRAARRRLRADQHAPRPDRPASLARLSRRAQPKHHRQASRPDRPALLPRLSQSAQPKARQPASPGLQEVASALRRQLVPNPTGEQPGTIVVNTKEKFLYLVLDDGQAIRYAVAVGKEGFGWNGVTKVMRKAEWPDWRPPPEMLARKPSLPRYMAGGPKNPLGARALYLFRGVNDSGYRIHGTNEPRSIGRAASSGCFRMLNEDVIDLYERVSTGIRVVVV